MSTKKKIKTFRDLHVWQEGHSLVIAIYKITDSFPKKEQFSLTNQLRRAGISITSNIAEGFSRITYKEKIRFYSISLGSLTEIQNQLLIAKDVKYITTKELEKLMDQSTVVEKLLNGLIRKSKEFT